MTKIQKLQTFLLLFTIYYLLFTIPPSAGAQTFSLGIYPPLLEVMMMPGKSITQAYQLENSGDATIINTTILPFEPADEHGNIRLPSEIGSVNFRSSSVPFRESGWFNFENADIALGKPFVLKSGETKQIVLKIKIPEGTREDDYYFTFLFSSKPKERVGRSGTQEAGVIGTNILLTVSRTGKPVKKGEIVEFKVKNSKFKVLDSFDKPEFTLRVKNTGKAFWKPFGKIKIEGLLGQKWEQELLPENVLAGSIRQIQVSTESASPPFLIGPYRAKVEFNLEEDGQGATLSRQTSFLALPGKLTLAILTALLLLWLIKSTFKGSTLKGGLT